VNGGTEVDIWRVAMLAGPPLAFVAPLVLMWLLGGFTDFQMVGKPVNFIQAFGILGAICFPFGVYFLARSQMNAVRAGVSQSWPSVPGIVQSSKIEKRLNGVPMMIYRLALTYRYDVDGRPYHGDTVQFGPRWAASRRLIEKLAEKYPGGAAVTVHYDPKDPNVAVLETSDAMAGQDWWRIVALLAAPLLISVFVAIKNAGP
jgi:hypothetical protein